MRSARAVGAIWTLLGSLLLAGCAHRTHYVALGDSYVAGPGVKHQRLGLCWKSGNNYPHLVDDQLGLALRDRSCSNATTRAMDHRQYLFTRPQLKSVHAKTDIVTLGIGGNDIGFLEVLVTCFATKNEGTPCAERFGRDAKHDVFRRIEGTRPKVVQTVRGIRARSPDAAVLLVGYPHLFPDEGGCFDVLKYTDGDVVFMGDVLVALNGMLADVAAETGATFVDLYTKSTGHDVCSGREVRWVEPLITWRGAPVHPNLEGMTFAAEQVRAAIEAAGVAVR